MGQSKERDTLVLYPENIKAKQNNSSLTLIGFCSLIYPGPLDVKYIYRRYPLRFIPHPWMS